MCLKLLVLGLGESDRGAVATIWLRATSEETRQNFLTLCFTTP